MPIPPELPSDASESPDPPVIAPVAASAMAAPDAGAPRVSRLAPSPTGALHLGNARTFLVNWALARRGGWTLRLRIEDIDSPRVKPEAIDRTRRLLDRLGLDHDGPVVVQSHDLEPYVDAARRLAGAGRLFACDRTRRDVEQAASAPHADDGAVVFPRELRPVDPAEHAWTGPARNHRFRVDDPPVAIDDRVRGTCVFDVAGEVGDFLVWTKRGVPSYQLAVVVDDLRQGVSDVVRGDDLLASAARQTLLYRALGAAPPTWWHLPLVVGADGRRLAKRHGDTRIERYLDEGIRVERIVGLLAATCGIGRERAGRVEPVEMDTAEFRERLDPASLRRGRAADREATGGGPVTFTAEDDAWLTA